MFGSCSACRQERWDQRCSDDRHRKGVERGDGQAVAADHVVEGVGEGHMDYGEVNGDEGEDDGDRAHEDGPEAGGPKVTLGAVPDPPLQVAGGTSHEELVELDGQGACGLDELGRDRERSTRRLQES